MNMLKTNSPPPQTQPTVEMRLSQLKQGDQAVIQCLLTPPDVTYRLIEMGLEPGEAVHIVRWAPLGDPLEIEVMNTRLAIRKKEAHQIVVSLEKPNAHSTSFRP